MSTYRDVVGAAYDARADEYEAMEVDEWPRLRRLREALDQLPDGADVLDLGCGSAVPAGPEITRRHRLVGVDVSREQIERARRNVPGGRFVRSDMASVAFPEDSFDAVVSFYAFDQVPRTEWRSLLRRIHAWLRPGGLLLVAAEDLDEPGSFGEWLGVPMYLSSFDAAGTTAEIEAAGFEVMSAEVEVQRERGPTGEVNEVPFTWVLARASNQ